MPNRSRILYVALGLIFVIFHQVALLTTRLN